MKLYLNNGYINMKALYDHQATFVFIVAARGIGKTYGAMDIIATKETKTLFLRKSERILENISSFTANPFKKYNVKNKREIEIKKVKGMNGMSAISETERLIGYAAALSTFRNVRGIDLSDVDFIFFDEFIGEEGEPTYKGEGNALFNLYETVNRNRELEGEKPVKLICAANSNSLGTGILIDWGLTDLLLKMKKKGKECLYIEDRSLLLVMPNQSVISDKKRNTALYRVSRNTKFSEMALDNEFSYDDTSDVKSMPLTEYNPICSIDEYTVYEHKSTGGLYVCPVYRSDVRTYRSDTKEGRFAVKKEFGIWFSLAIKNRDVTYSNFAVKKKFVDIFTH